MANFDTQQKRFSGMGLGLDEAPLLPKPDATIALGDRQHFLDAYSGIAFGAPVAPPAGGAASAWNQLPWQHPPHQAAPHSSAWSFSIFPRRLSLGGLT